MKISWRIFAVWLFVIGFICYVWFVSQPFGKTAIAKEGGAITWLSTVILFSISVQALNLNWFIVSAGFCYLAIDEQFMIHERIGGYWPMLITGIAGLVLVPFFIKNTKGIARILIVTSIFLGLCIIVLDACTRNFPVFEEILEIVAESIFLTGLLVKSGKDIRI